MPLIHASANLDFFNEDNPNAFTYKQYLLQIVKEMKTANIHLQNIEDNTKAVKDKLHA
ncbi:MAG: hypothetical protein ACREBR_04855 [bacterium]